MSGIKSLAKDTAVYGLSSIIGRFLNWCLVPLYVWIFPTDEYGIVSYLYSFTAVALVILNYGMETGFFRYANKEPDPERVYTTSLISVGFTSLLFMVLVSVLIGPVSGAAVAGPSSFRMASRYYGGYRRFLEYSLRISSLSQPGFSLCRNQAA